jgi:hypothetical protein
MEGQPKGLAWRNPAKPGFRHEVPEMRPYYLKNFVNATARIIYRIIYLNSACFGYIILQIFI